jgi:DNA polymerase-3 subunit delta'
LVALSDHLLLPTIVSRCQILPLRTLGRETVQQALQDRWGVDEKRAQLLAALSLGRIGWAVQALQNERLLQQRQEDLSSLVQLLEAGLLDRFSFAEKQERLWKRKEHAAVFGLLEHWKSWWRDLLMMGTGCPDLITNVDYVDLLQAAARQIGPDTARQALKQLGDVQQRLQEQVNVRLVFEDLFLRLPAVVISTHTGS